MIIPALLTNDLEQAKVKLHSVRGLSEWIQLDIMDGKFVEHSTLTIENYKNLEISEKIELHLMVENPHEQFEAAKEIGADRVLFHLEASSDETIKQLKNYSFQKGVAINPGSDISKLEPYIDSVEVILIMGVIPGESGQEILPSTFQKIKDIHAKYPDKILEIDGGVRLENIEELKAAGISLFGVTSALFGADNVIERYKELNHLIG